MALPTRSPTRGRALTSRFRRPPHNGGSERWTSLFARRCSSIYLRNSSAHSKPQVVSSVISPRAPLIGSRCSLLFRRFHEGERQREPKESERAEFASMTTRGARTQQQLSSPKIGRRRSCPFAPLPPRLLSFRAETLPCEHVFVVCVLLRQPGSAESRPGKPGARSREERLDRRHRARTASGAGT